MFKTVMKMTKFYFGARRTMDTLPSILFAGVAGAALMYLFDPDRGRRRRHITRDKFASMFRRSGTRVTKLSKYAAGHAYGLSQQISHKFTPHTNEYVDDITLARKVESILFREPGVQKGRINISAVNGVVELRGEVDRIEQIHEFEAEVRKIAGVRDVTNLLHLPHTPAPNKQEALEAS